MPSAFLPQLLLPIRLTTKSTSASESTRQRFECLGCLTTSGYTASRRWHAQACPQTYPLVVMHQMLSQCLQTARGRRLCLCQVWSGICWRGQWDGESMGLPGGPAEARGQGGCTSGAEPAEERQVGGSTGGASSSRMARYVAFSARTPHTLS